MFIKKKDIKIGIKNKVLRKKLIFLNLFIIKAGNCCAILNG